MEPRYIGDGVYVSFDGVYVWLRTGSHDSEKNVVALEADVFFALKNYGNEAFDMVP